MARGPDPLSRRGFLGACAALAAEVHGFGAAEAAPAPVLETSVLDVGGDRHLARRALVAVPKGGAGERWPVLVLLHGLGETGDEQLGLHAWSGRYGLLDADARLRAPPVTSRRGPYLPSARLAQINAALASRAFRGFVLVCPVTPNVYKQPWLSPPVALDRYAEWIASALLPRVYATTPSLTDPASTAIDGCSLGGYMALEVFLRKPDVFGAVGGVQTAISERAGIVYADRLRAAMDKVGPRPLHIESSEWDPSLVAHRAMSARLKALSVAHDLDVLPGGHDQIFLREAGTLEMLLWHDRRVASARGA